ncbi:MAG: hypothetical protein JWR14_6966 [Caballeronia sp.]|nr:hypothetical protein [Caballeronia sp.]
MPLPAMMSALLKVDIRRNNDRLLILLRQFGQLGHWTRGHHVRTIQRTRLQNGTARAAVNPCLRVQNKRLTACLGECVWRRQTRNKT